MYVTRPSLCKIGKSSRLFHAVHQVPRRGSRAQQSSAKGGAAASFDGIWELEMRRWFLWTTNDNKDAATLHVIEIWSVWMMNRTTFNKHDTGICLCPVPQQVSKVSRARCHYRVNKLASFKLSRDESPILILHFSCFHECIFRTCHGRSSATLPGFAGSCEQHRLIWEESHAMNAGRCDVGAPVSVWAVLKLLI